MDCSAPSPCIPDSQLPIPCPDCRCILTAAAYPICRGGVVVPRHLPSAKLLHKGIKKYIPRDLDFCPAKGASKLAHYFVKYDDTTQHPPQPRGAKLFKIKIDALVWWPPLGIGQEMKESEKGDDTATFVPQLSQEHQQVVFYKERLWYILTKGS